MGIKKVFRIGKKKKEIVYIEKEKERRFKKPSFCFKCSPRIRMATKTLAKELHEDKFVVAEHALQLGLMDIADVAKNPGELEMLRVYLHQEHVLEHLVVSVSAYDGEAEEYIQDGQSLLH